MSELKAIYATDKDSVTGLYYPKSETDKYIAKLKAKLAEQDSENRSLKRAFYNACTMWADRTRLICSIYGSIAPMIRWERMRGKCRALAKQYKESK